MQKIKIGVWDDELEYATRLSVFLQRYGKGKWDVSAFTDSESIKEYSKKHSLDLLIGTDEHGLRMFDVSKQMQKLWLTDDARNQSMGGLEVHVIYRFQGADVIGQMVNQIVREKQYAQEHSKKLVAVYSPVGRCGKTTFALNLVQERAYGRWFYIGMEDYSTFDESEMGRKGLADEFFYYWKTHNKEKVKSFFNGTENVIVSGNSFFDVRQMDEGDIEWLRASIEEIECNGILFDIGSGVLQEFRLLEVFDVILVPFVEDEFARKKKRNFELMFGYQEMEECRKHLHYLNMTNQMEREHQLQQIFGGDEW